MAENTKTPPNQDRPRTPQGEPHKPQKPGDAMPGSNPDRGRQGVTNPNKPEIDPERDRNRGRPMGPGKDGAPGVDDLDDDDDSTQRMSRD
jgi:hypothetical protein